MSVALTPDQIERGLANTHKARLLIVDAARRNKRISMFFNSLSPRHKGLIYFTAGIAKERHILKFNDLTDSERLAVVRAMRELRNLIASFPRSLTDADSVVSNND